MYWPAVQMLMWGFLQLYVSQNAGSPFMRAASTFIGAVMLWDVLFRGQLGFSISFLEEMYARNMGNLMMSPLRPIELVLALMVQSVVRLAIGMVPVSLLAIWWFDFNPSGGHTGVKKFKKTFGAKELPAPTLSTESASLAVVRKSRRLMKSAGGALGLP